MENKDKILMANGTVIDRTHFLQDLKVGDKLVGYSQYRKSTNIYTVESIGRKYATLSDNCKMSLDNGLCVNKEYSQFTITFFKTQEELESYLSNLKDREELRSMLSKINAHCLDIEQVCKLKDALLKLQE